MLLPLTNGGVGVGGASKAGLKFTGLSDTGVFVEEVLPGIDSEVKDQIQSGDQLLQFNETKIGKLVCHTHSLVDLSTLAI